MKQPRPFLLAAAILLMAALISTYSSPATPTFAFDNLPAGFESQPIIGGIADPAGMRFAPDGRLFIGERISGRLLIATYDEGGDTWTVNPTPFYTFPIPRDDDGNPERVRSAGLRDIEFDPNFSSNGFIYAFYMNDDTRQNRVVRIKANSSNSNVADATFGEQLLIDLPYNDSNANGSHNGGALAFGFDGNLYITTGDGWTGDPPGDPVQSLTTFTGKVLRIHADGTIPTDNPFYNQTNDAYRAIYALGLRNPYSMSRHPETGTLYINEARGDAKADIYLVEARANYGHEGSGIGNLREPWANGAEAGSQLITGGAWYPAGGSFPTSYEGAYFMALWGSNASNRGQISFIESDSDTSVTAFERNVGLDVADGSPIKPVLARVGPNGHLYYMLTTYETNEGTIYRVRYTAQQTVERPFFSPDGNTYSETIQVSLSSATSDATIYYTLDGSDPNQNSAVYSSPLTIGSDTLLKARAYRSGFNSSAIGSATYTIGEPQPNWPPIADAGKDVTVEVGTTIPLDGSGSIDPDGDDELLRDEQWTQISGPLIEIADAGEEVAYVTPQVPGTYVFELSISDPHEATGSDQMTLTAVSRISCPSSSLAAHYTFEAGIGPVVFDQSTVGEPLDLAISGGEASWLPNGGLALAGDVQLATTGAATKIIAGAMASNELAVEAWVQPANIVQDGPARIVSVANGLDERNFMLGQGRWGSEPSDLFDVRLRTDSEVVDENGRPSVSSARVANISLTHVVLTRDEEGEITIYVNNDLVATDNIPGTFANWDSGYPLSLGNEVGGGRSWAGTLYEVRIYSCALSVDEVATAFARGPNSVPPSSAELLYLPFVLRR